MNNKWSLWTLICLIVGYCIRIIVENHFSKKQLILVGDKNLKRTREMAAHTDLNRRGIIDSVHFRVMDLNTGELFYPNEIEQFIFKVYENYVDDVRIKLRNGKLLNNYFIPTEGCSKYDIFGRELFVGDYVKYNGEKFVVNKNLNDIYLINENKKVELNDENNEIIIIGTVFEKNVNNAVNKSIYLSMMDACNEKLKIDLYAQALIAQEKVKNRKN